MQFCVVVRGGRDEQAVDPPSDEVAQQFVAAQETVTVAQSATLRVRPGQESTVDLRLTTDAASPISVDVRLASPWHTWDLSQPPAAGIDVPAGGRATLRIPVQAADDHASSKR